MEAPIKGPVREARLHDEIIVDAYNEYERATSWLCYLNDQLSFPFRAECFEKRARSPLGVKDRVEVTKLAPEEECEREVLAMIRRGGDELAVPLAQLKPINASEETVEAIEDWHYWVGMGYQF